MYSPGLNIGDLLEKLKAFQLTADRDEELNVVFDFAHMVPNLEFNSYRGYYEDVAIGYHQNNNFKWKSVGLDEFIVFVEGLLGQEWTGYKGGEFMGQPHTSVWVALEDSACTGCYIKDVRRKYHNIILETSVDD